MKAPGVTEIGFQAATCHNNPYLSVQLDVEFFHPASGTKIRRPAFWCGGDRWKVRFVSNGPVGEWRWRSECNVEDVGLQGRSGTVEVTEATKLLRMAPGNRVAQWSDGTPWLMVADTVWALPFRATPEEVSHYAAFRAAQGFNAALLMVIQPDRHAEGPEDRREHAGFGRGFDDVPEVELKKLRPDYFEQLDELLDILHDHGIVPVYQPVFHGWGWRGKSAVGRDIPAEDAARFARYLVARYGARPAIWLVGGDGTGREASVGAAGIEVEACDAYRQPTGIHYGPQVWPNAHQAEPWLDFQWCQTGHNGEHKPERVALMTTDRPVKAVANGEPTYERMGHPERACGWWQGHEAWSNLFCGATMGVVYGAGSLWQWKRPGEEGLWDSWAVAEGVDWRQALEFEGARYVGLVGRIMGKLPMDEALPDPTLTYGRRALVAPGKWAALYLEQPGGFARLRREVSEHFTAFDARTGEVVRSGVAEVGAVQDVGDRPCIVVFAPPS